jgi:PPOX class probable F420-dependent enzyme
VHQTSAADTNAEASATIELKLARFQKQRVLGLESYKKSGEPKRTPVIFVELDRKLYFQTALKAWKAKRVLKNPNVRVAPSTFRGTPKAD